MKREDGRRKTEEGRQKRADGNNSVLRPLSSVFGPRCSVLRPLSSLVCLLFSLFLVLPGPAIAALEREQLAIEREIKSRIEDVLSKTLPVNSFIVNVKVEMEAKKTEATVRRTRRTTDPNNPFLNQERFVLPGVPVKKELTANRPVEAEDTETTPANPQSLIKRILISILVAPDVPQEQIRALQDVVTGNIPFNPLRGDEIDIQNSTLLKPIGQGTQPQGGEPQGSVGAAPGGDAGPGGSASSTNWPLWVLAGLGVAIFAFLVAFLFGPVRAFLNRLLAVLPRVGEQAAYAVSNAPGKPTSNGHMSVDGRVNAYGNGAGRRASDGVDMPFRFINEDTVNKLPILLRQMPANQTAVVLAYLSPEWAGRVLNGLDTATQSAVMRELSQAREIPPDIVKDIETQVKSKLPYLVGGTDWISSVYQLTQPQTQKALLGTLNQQSPELAQTLRRKSFFYEDIVSVAPGALRLLIQEAGYPTMAAALKDERPEVRTAMLTRLPAATKEILEQEIEVAPTDPVAGADAKARVAAAGRKLLGEGRIQLPERSR